MRSKYFQIVGIFFVITGKLFGGVASLTHPTIPQQHNVRDEILTNLNFALAFFWYRSYLIFQFCIYNNISWMRSKSLEIRKYVTITECKI